MLVVIAIIAVLAAMILPAVAMAKQKAKVKKAQLEIAQLVQAINAYYNTYSRYPVSTNVMQYSLIASPLGTPDDYTYGGTFTPPNGSTFTIPPNPRSLQAPYLQTNDEVIAILMDLTTYPINGAQTVNWNHVKNTQQIKFLNAFMASDTNTPGVGPDLVYRDPWLNPYIISMDLNYDDKCMDAVYRKQIVSQVPGSGNGAGYNGLYNSTDNKGDGDNYSFNGGVMVWSLGPDMNASVAKGATAITAPNKDNVLSWTQ
jgi:type II secretory pathway pseudopilin PulG